MTVTQTPVQAAPNAPVDSAKTSPPNVEEFQYLDLVREILNEGELRRDRYVKAHSPAAPPLPPSLMGAY